jgi:hypothetical protein
MLWACTATWPGSSVTALAAQTSGSSAQGYGLYRTSIQSAGVSRFQR